jgi:hypothetical protein
LDGQSISTDEQRDAFEILTMFFDKIEEHLKGTPEEHMVKKLFGGTLTHEFTCKNCNHVYENDEPFLALTLPVKNKRDVFQGLNSYIEGELLSGQNAAYCEKCSGKRDTIKRAMIKTLPKYLILVLKRFDYKVELNARLKINDYYRIPWQLNLDQYTVKVRHQMKRKMSTSIEDDTTGAPRPLSMPEEHSMPKMIRGGNLVAGSPDYEIAGFVIHHGIADAGHYYSYIRERITHGDRERKWHEFNDCIVRPATLAHIEQEANGIDSSYDYTETASRTRNAYILFYDQAKHTAGAGFSEDSSKVEEGQQRQASQQMEILSCPPSPEFSADLATLLQIDPQKVTKKSISVEGYHAILQKNEKYFNLRTTFSPEFNQFVQKYLDKPLERGYPSKLIEFLFLYYFTVLVRSKDKTALPIFYRFLKQEASVTHERSLEVNDLCRTRRQLCICCKPFRIGTSCKSVCLNAIK